MVLGAGGRPLVLCTDPLKVSLIYNPLRGGVYESSLGRCLAPRSFPRSSSMSTLRCVLALLCAADALRPTVHPRCTPQMLSDSHSRRAVVLGGAAALLQFGSSAHAAAPKAPAKDPNKLDLESLGLTKEALGLEEPKKKRGPAKPPLPGQKAKTPPKPKKPLTRQQVEQKKKKEKARQEKARVAKKKADAKAEQKKKEARAKAKEAAQREAEEKRKAAAELKVQRAWKGYTDDRSGKSYYYNSVTKESTYTKPSSM